MARKGMDKSFQCSFNGSEFPVRIKISKKAFEECEKYGIYTTVTGILNQRPIEIISGSVKRKAIKKEPAFYEFWTGEKKVLRTSKGAGNPRSGMVLEFDKIDKGMHK